jgi:hypothetical protein
VTAITKGEAPETAPPTRPLRAPRTT